jgi:hypothetical protein
VSLIVSGLAGVVGAAVRALVGFGAAGAWASAGLRGVVTLGFASPRLLTAETASVFVGFGLVAVSASASAESAALTASAIWAALGWAGLIGALCAGRGWAGLIGAG